jgi:hypothetical protein
MSYSRIDFKNDVEKILSICQEDLQALSIGQGRQASKEQIEGTIIPEMSSFLEMIEKKEIPSKNQRWIISTAYITRGWNWDIQNCGELAIKLAQLDDKYRYELEE